MKKLYENQCYLKENDTIVTEAFERDKKKYISLEETIFFPEEGGQYADTGYIFCEDKKVRVKDGVLEDDKIFYEVSELIEVGKSVHCELDFDERYMKMQNHTGEHILTAAIYNEFGYDNVGFHLSDEIVTMDVSGPLSFEQALRMETIANEIVYKNLSIFYKYPSKEELENLTYRSKSGIEGQVRLVYIGGENNTINHDICACCAPHVAKTGEVGIIKILNLQSYKGGTRLSILCGKRALLYFREQMGYLQKITNYLSTRPEKVVDIVDGYKNQIFALEGKVSKLNKSILETQISAKQKSGEKYIFLSEDSSPDTLKDGYNMFAGSVNGFVGVFLGDEQNGYRYNAGSKNLDSTELFSMMKEKLDAKGGGNCDMIQGKVMAKKADIISFFDSL